MLSWEYKSHGEERKWGAKRSLLKSVTVRLPFSSDHVVYLHFFKFFVLPTNATITQSIEDQKKTDTMMNNYSINCNDSNTFDLWVIMWLCSKACESEFGNPWRNICGSNVVENLPSVVTSQTSTTWAGTKDILHVGNDDLRSGCWWTAGKSCNASVLFGVGVPGYNCYTFGRDVADSTAHNT